MPPGSLMRSRAALGRETSLSAGDLRRQAVAIDPPAPGALSIRELLVRLEAFASAQHISPADGSRSDSRPGQIGRRVLGMLADPNQDTEPLDNGD